MIAGSQALQKTDDALATSPTKTFTRSGQSELADLIEKNGVSRLWTSDYDLSGMLDVHLPAIDITHGWGDVSRRGRKALPDLLKAAKGGHYLGVRPSAPMIYNLRPQAEELQELAKTLDLRITLEGQLTDDHGTWAELYSVR